MCKIKTISYIDCLALQGCEKYGGNFRGSWQASTPFHLWSVPCWSMWAKSDVGALYWILSLCSGLSLLLLCSHILQTAHNIPFWQLCGLGSACHSMGQPVSFPHTMDSASFFLSKILGLLVHSRNFSGYPTR